MVSRTRRHFFQFLLSSRKTFILKGFAGWLFVGLVEEICDPLSTPLQYYTLGDLFGHSVSIWTIAQVTPCHGLPYSKWAPDIDGVILHKDDQQEGRERISFPYDGPSPRVELPYAYLMAWFTLYCLVLIQPGEEPLEGICDAHLCRFENSHWEGTYLAGIQRLVDRQDSYNLF